MNKEYEKGYNHAHSKVIELPYNTFGGFLGDDFDKGYTSGRYDGSVSVVKNDKTYGKRGYVKEKWAWPKIIPDEMKYEICMIEDLTRTEVKLLIKVLQNLIGVENEEQAI